MKKCPFCAEDIQDEAIKCRFCGEFLDKRRKPPGKWYFSTATIVIAILCVGPFALPLVWFNPRYKAVTKLVVTVFVIVLTVIFYYLTKMAFSRLSEQLHQVLGSY